MPLNLLRRGAWVAIAIVAAAGCASHRSASVITGHAPRDSESLEVYIGKVRQLSLAAAPRRARATTIEQQDPELRTSLEALRTAATAPAERRVADAYRRAGVLDLAYDHYLAARHLDIHDAAAYDGLARIWRDWGLPHLGLGDASRALYYAPTSAAAYNTFGTVLYALGQTTEAGRAFERALTLDPKAAYAWTNLCYHQFETGDFNAAAASCGRAITLDPALTAARNDLALVYAAAGDMGEADAQFAAVNSDPATRYYNVGIVMAAARRYPEAERAFAAAHALRPEWTIASERARQARRLAHQPEVWR